MDLSRTPEAPTQITEASLTPATADLPSLCRVRGYVAPQVGFEVQLPLTSWSGRFLHVGCGAHCGAIEIEQCAFGVRRGYACIVSDAGHTSTALDGKWGIDNLQGIIDFAYRATHVVTIAGKEIAKQFYGKNPLHSYFVGCSGGGRQGLVEAQRFPWDFDGIVAGAPVLYKNLSSMHLLWTIQVTHTPSGDPIISPEEALRLHDAVLQKCDRNDGLADGLIGDPTSCRVDLSQLACRPDKEKTCLTANQLEVAYKLYSGARGAKGEALYWGVMPGSESNWPKLLNEVPSGRRPLRALAVDHFRYLAFMPSPGASWQPDELDPERDSRRFDVTEALYSAANPDLRRFKAAGGKIMMYAGWGDPQIPPGSIVDYYETLTRTMQGQADTESFARLFMLPGVGHCGGGGGADTVDFLTYLERWVERDEAPERLIAARLRKPVAPGDQANFPLDPANIVLTRPVFPYPAWPKYKGVGNPQAAENFAPAFSPERGAVELTQQP